MASLLTRLRAGGPDPAGSDELDRLGFQAYVDMVTKYSFNGVSYTLGSTSEPGQDFEQLVQGVHNSSNVVAAAVFARALLLKQTRFAWMNRSRGSGSYRQLFGNESLALFERPDPGRLTRPEWLAAAEVHESYAGSAYTARRDGPAGPRLEVLRPDRVDVLMGASSDDVDPLRPQGMTKLGYIHYPDGRENPETSESLFLDQVMHWHPEPHPLMWWTGQSWVTSVLAEVTTDRAAQKHLRKFFDNAATPNLIVKPHEMLSPEQIDEYKERFGAKYEGVGNSFRTLWLGAGSDAMVVGSQLADLDLSNLQGGGETRIAARARVPAAILGIREGLAGSALNAGNYNSARRQFVDMWYAPTIEDFCAAAEVLVPAPPGGPAELSWDPSESLALQEDALDSAKIMQSNAASIRQLVDAGMDPDAVVAAVRDGNLSALVGAHTGLTSVQLVPPSDGGTDNESDENNE